MATSKDLLKVATWLRHEAAKYVGYDLSDIKMMLDTAAEDVSEASGRVALIEAAERAASHELRGAVSLPAELQGQLSVSPE